MTLTIKSLRYIKVVATFGSKAILLDSPIV